MSVVTAYRPGRTRQARLGFLGVGWIGRNRMESILAAGCAQAVAIADPCLETATAAGHLATGARLVGSLDELLACAVDGIVIATPSGLHASQAIAALEHGAAVFCQKPLGRTVREVNDVLVAARRADRLLAVDLSYRWTEGMKRIAGMVRDGMIGEVYAADLVFHNAYGPDKQWCREPALAGGGCVIDLGVHLVDLALWTLGGSRVEHVSSDLYAGGRRLGRDPGEVEDHAVATVRLATGAVVRIACSWWLHAGRDAEIAATFYGTEGTLVFSNVDGSFYDFRAELLRGTSREQLAGPPDAWGPRAAVDWALRVAGGAGFDVSVEDSAAVAEIIDRIYCR